MNIGMSTIGPSVWTGRALQAESDDLERSYERFAWSAATRPSMASRTASRACSTDAMA
jgi:hypothetical protein